MTKENSLPELLGNAAIDRVTPLRDQIYLIIRGAIVTGRLKPGDSIDSIETSLTVLQERTALSQPPLCMHTPRSVSHGPWSAAQSSC